MNDIELIRAGKLFTNTDGVEPTDGVRDDEDGPNTLPAHIMAMLTKKLVKGGEGSGYHGHAGRPGERGGSAPSGDSRPGNLEDARGTRDAYFHSLMYLQSAKEFAHAMSKDPEKGPAKLKNELLKTGLDNMTLSQFNGEIADDLARRTGFGRQEILDYMAAWRQGASNNEKSVAMQLAASQKFGTSTDFIERKQGANGVKVSSEDVDHARKLIDAVYDSTQERLAAAGIKEITLVRGERGWQDAPPGSESADGVVTQVNANPMTSFSSSPSLSRSFAEETQGGATTHLFDVVTVPASRVISMGTTGLGAIQEQEFIVAGGPMTIRTFNMGDTAQGRYSDGGKTVNAAVRAYQQQEIHHGFFG